MNRLKIYQYNIKIQNNNSLNINNFIKDNYNIVYKYVDNVMICSYI